MKPVQIKYLLFLTIFIIISCERVVEKNIIEKEEMINILIDIHLMEESIDLLKLDSDTSRALFDKKEIEIFEKYSVSERLYRESFSYYFFNPQELDDIYVSIIDSLMLYQQTKK